MYINCVQVYMETVKTIQIKAMQCTTYVLHNTCITCMSVHTYVYYMCIICVDAGWTHWEDQCV